MIYTLLEIYLFQNLYGQFIKETVDHYSLKRLKRLPDCVINI